MHQINHSALVPHSAEKMFELVNNIQDYPEFIPHCAKTQILEKSDHKIIASLYLKKGPFSQSFTTENILSPSHSIKLNLVDGPFSNLEGEWTFEKLNQDACRVSLCLNFEIRNNLLNQIFAKLFDHLANQMLDAFCQRAEKIYGKN